MENNLMKLAAIWLDYSVNTIHINGVNWTTPRIASGDSIGIKDGKIVNIDDEDAEPATVIECYGDEVSSILKMEVVFNNGSIQMIEVQGKGN